MAAYCKTKGLNISELTSTHYQEIMLSKYGFKDWDSLVAAIGHGALKEGQVINRILEYYEKEHKEKVTDEQVLELVHENSESKLILPKAKANNGIIVKGISGVAIRFMRCCNPLPGDEIVGFVTRGRGVSIHRTDCINVITMPEIERARLIEADWDVESPVAAEKYVVEITIYANHRRGLISDASKVFMDSNIDIMSMNTKTNKQGVDTINISFEVSSRDQFSKTVEKIRQIEGVVDIDRNGQ